MNYFKNFRAEYHLLKIGYIASLASFDKSQGCQYNLSLKLLCFVKKETFIDRTKLKDIICMTLCFRSLVIFQSITILRE